MNVMFVVKKKHGDCQRIMCNAELKLRNSEFRKAWVIDVCSELGDEFIVTPSKEEAIAEFERIANEIRNGARVVTIEEKTVE